MGPARLIVIRGSVESSVIAFVIIADCDLQFVPISLPVLLTTSDIDVDVCLQLQNH
jgi:hypothetical protein